MNSEDNEMIEGTKESIIDVTAQVGQTIIVKEVDANGKPTKWESADYQPRTHWTEFGEILPETTIQLNDGQLEIPNSPYVINDGERYRVTWNGEVFECEAKSNNFDGTPLVYIGNASILGLDDTGEPFTIAYVSAITTTMIVSADSSTATITIKVEGEIVTPIPTKYLGNAFPYYIECTEEVVEGKVNYICTETRKNVEPVLRSGRDIILKLNFDLGLFFMTVSSWVNLPDGSMWLSFFGHDGISDYVQDRLFLWWKADGTLSITDKYPLSN